MGAGGNEKIQRGVVVLPAGYAANARPKGLTGANDAVGRGGGGVLPIKRQESRSMR